MVLMNVENFFLKNNGYARMKDLKFAGFHTSVMSSLI